MKYILIVVALSLASCGQLRGEKGESGLNGIDGVPGNTGATGPQGDRGPAGVDASPVVMVKLCPGTPVYPTTFIEYAFCINHELYATYSANDGFTTILPPGRYTSNGINSRCDFTVSANCGVNQ